VSEVSYEVHVEVPVEELRQFVGDVEKAIHKWKLGVLDDIRRESSSHAQKLASTRMPSGGSYIRRIKWRDLRRGSEDYVSELYNDHQWAMAVERGTKPHPIESEKLMTAYPLLATRGGKERPYGIRYGKKRVRGRRFQHPGSRAFWIFRDTARHINTILEVIVERVVRRLRI